jgi:antimicrobial peptide system SdpB family protein
MLKSVSNEINRSLNATLQRYSELNPWTNVYGLARSVLASGLLLTILFSEESAIFYDSSASINMVLPADLSKIGLFNILSDQLLLAKFISIGALLWVISGYLPQVSCFFQWWVTFSFMISAPTMEGGDQINNIICLLLIPVCVFDNRLNHWYRAKDSNRTRRKLVAWSCIAVICLQISIIYFHACVSKFAVPEWSNGTAVYYWATHNIFGVSYSIKSVVSDLLSNSVIIILITWGTLLLELLLFAWIFVRRNRWNWRILFIAGVGFHFMIIVFHGLVSFFIAMLGALILYLVPKEYQIKFLLR